tara:strand:+ start:519 stop:713 length:195 start_codon:yes stop_codon:yes gene_type:complete
MAKVTFAHLRELRYCVPGVKRFCARHGIELREFRDGVETERMRATGDRYARIVADLAEQRERDA